MPAGCAPHLCETETLAAGLPGQRLSHVVAGCAGQGPGHPRTCEIGAQSPALSKVLSCAFRPGERKGGWGGPRILGAASGELGRGQPWPAALLRHLSPNLRLLASGPENAHWRLSHPLPSLLPAWGQRHLCPQGTEPQDHRSPAPPVCPEDQGGVYVCSALLPGPLGVSAGSRMRMQAQARETALRGELSKPKAANRAHRDTQHPCQAGAPGRCPTRAAQLLCVEVCVCVRPRVSVYSSPSGSYPTCGVRGSLGCCVHISDGACFRASGWTKTDRSGGGTSGQVGEVR